MSDLTTGKTQVEAFGDFEIGREAERLFTEHNRANGALMPFGLGWLSAEAKKPWLAKAEGSLRARKERA